MIFPASLRITWPRFLRLLTVALPCALLTACGTTGGGQTTHTETQADEACLVLPEPLPDLTDPSLAGMVRNHRDVADAYWRLAKAHTCLVNYERGRK